MMPWLQGALGVMMAIVGLLQLTVLVGFKTGRFTATTESSARDLIRRLDSCDDRLERANHESSKVAGMVQALIGQVDRLPNDLREIFVSRETMELHISQWKQDRDAMWTAIGDRRKNGR